MKIDTGTVSMSSERSYYTHFEKQSETLLTTSDKAATLEFSDESKSLVEQMKEHKEEEKRKVKEQQQEQQKKNMENLMLTQTKKQEAVEGAEAKSPEQIRLEVMKRILELLNRMRKNHGLDALKGLAGEIRQMEKELGSTAPAAEYSAPELAVSGNGASSGNVGTPSVPRREMTWKKVTVTSAFYTEAEHTAYSSTGIVKTADGREISFNVDVEMSHAFCDRYESCIEEEIVFKDPLVINLDSNVGSVTDQKFLFDLDADGTEEEISFAGEGSGFLALDKNGDGKINDGSELFGTQSGDGFGDLAAYDKDGNGWIDESDDVFADLRIWTKDENGNNVLMNLKDANVGAIYLGKASTQYSLRSEGTHELNGAIRSTGIYLKETGEAGTIQHIDLAV